MAQTLKTLIHYQLQKNESKGNCKKGISIVCTSCFADVAAFFISKGLDVNATNNVV